jgi:hypothetical protein
MTGFLTRHRTSPPVPLPIGCVSIVSQTYSPAHVMTLPLGRDHRPSIGTFHRLFVYLERVTKRFAGGCARSCI